MRKRFLWAKLQALNISEIRIEDDVLEALKKLVPPKGMMSQLFETYAAGFESMEHPIEQQFALRSIAILSQTTSSMTKEMFLAALSIDLESGKVNMKHYNRLSQDPDLIIRLCNYLIEINESLGVFRFYHPSIFEFFRSYSPYIYSSRIAQLCLAHLASSDFSHGPYTNAQWYDYKGLGPVLKEHPLLEFASRNWFVHATRSKKPHTATESEQMDVDLLKQFEKLLQHGNDSKNLQLSFQIYRLAIRMAIPTAIYHEHIISYFSLLGFLDEFEYNKWFDLKRCDSDGLTPIHWAICNGARSEDEKKHASKVVEKLIEFGGDINAQDDQGCTPVYYAAHYGNQHVLQLLLRNYAELDTLNNENETALIAACKKHHEEIIGMLLEAGADIQIESSIGTALHMVSIIGCSNCVEKILIKYGDGPIVEAQSPFGTALHAAAFHGHIDVVQLLCNRGFDVHAKNDNYGSIITAAATGGHKSMNPKPFREIFDELIKRKVDVNDQSGLCGPALRATAYYGHKDLVELLLKNGARIDLAKGPMGTAYEAAESEDHKDIMALLLERDPQAASYGKTDPKDAEHYQKLQRILFKGALKASNMELLNRLVIQVEDYFEKRLEKGKTQLFENMLGLGKLVFIDVIDLSISANKKRLNRKNVRQSVRSNPPEEEELRRSEESTPTSPPDSNALEWLIMLLKSLFSSLLCIKLFNNEPGSMPQPPSENGLVDQQSSQAAEGLVRRPTLKDFILRRQSTTFGGDSLDGRFPQVLDRLTQAAVKILEHAIFNGSPEVIKLIADTWVEALNNLVGREGSEQLLKSVVESRVAELKKFLADSSLTSDQRFDKAKGLACVGVELLYTACRQEQKYKRLIFILSKLWASALESVEDLGEEGQEPIKDLIQVFVGKFSKAIRGNDELSVGIWQLAGVEILRGAALQPKKRILVKFSGEWAKQWSFLIEKNMGKMVRDLLQAKWKEYQACITNKRYEEALGLALGVMELFRAAVELGETSVLDQLMPVLSEIPGWTIAAGNNESQVAEHLDGPLEFKDKCLYTEVIFDFTMRLFPATEHYHPARPHMKTLASSVLDSLKSISDESLQTFVNIGHQRIEAAENEAYIADAEASLMQIAHTVFYLLEISNDSDSDGKEKAAQALKKLVKPLSWIIEKGDFSRYKVLPEVLKEAGVVQKTEQVL